MKKHTTVKKFNFKKLKKPLKWLDCVSQTGWLSVAQMDAAEPAKCTTGDFWIYKDNKDFITLFCTYSQDKDCTIEFGEVITIPKKWI